MANLKFTDTYNMVEFLSKSKERDGFEQIMDFLNAHTIKCALTVNPTIYTSCIEQFWSSVTVKAINGETQLHARVDGKKIIITESYVRRNLQLADENGIDCLPNSTIFEQLALMGPKTTAWNEFSSTMASAIILFLEQQLDDVSTHKRIYVAPSHTKKIFANMRRVGKGFSGRVTPLFPTMVVQSQSQLGEDEAVHKELGDRLVRPDTTASSLEAEWWSEVPRNHGDTTAQTRVLDLEKIKTTQAEEIASLKRRLKKLEQKKRSRTHGLKRLRKIGATARVKSSDDEESLGDDASKQGMIVAVKGVNERRNVVEEVVEVIKTAKLIIDAIQVSVAGDKGCAASAPTTVSAATTTTVDDITLAQALDQGKGILVEPEKPLKMKDQIRLDEETALRLQAKFDEEGRIAREKAQKEEEANIALIETWDDIQAKIDVDHQLAKRLQAQEQEELSVEEKAKLFQQLLETRRKQFAAKRAEENRNKPPTKAQERKIMSNYLKNME
ncbi:hypothetical protein Tco_1237545 [Tanacetum coccineum]